MSVKLKMSNELALEILFNEGYSADCFKYPDYYGIFIPLDIWLTHVKKINPAFKIGQRIILRGKSTRTLQRVFNVEENKEISYSLGIGDGNVYPIDFDTGLDRSDILTISSYSRQPLKVGNTIIVNLLQAFRLAKHDYQNGIKYLSSWRPSCRERLDQVRTQEDLDKLINDMGYLVRYNNPTPSFYFKYVTLSSDDVLPHVKNPIGYVTQVYVHFERTWEFKRELRYHITFDHGVRCLLTKDWLEKSYDTPLDFNQKFVICDHADINKDCNKCMNKHNKIHIGIPDCAPWRCAFQRALKTVQCVPNIDYEKQCMNRVHRGFHPEPVEPDMTSEHIDKIMYLRHIQDIQREFYNENASFPATKTKVFQYINDEILTHAGGRING